DGSPINSQNGKSPLPGGQARRNKLLVSWGPLVIGTVRVAFCNAATVGFPVAKMTSGASATNSFAYRRWRSALPASQRNPHIAAIGPAQLLQRLQERCISGLCFWIIRRASAHPAARALRAATPPRRQGA